MYFNVLLCAEYILSLCMLYFIYLGFYVAFNTVQVISRRVVGRAEETSTYSSLGFCTVFLYLFGVLRRFQHCTGHITTGSWMGRGNQYIEFARVLYFKLPTNGKQLPAFPHKALTGIEPGLRGGRREFYHSATVAPLTINIYNINK